MTNIFLKRNSNLMHDNFIHLKFHSPFKDYAEVSLDQTSLLLIVQTSLCIHCLPLSCKIPHQICQDSACSYVEVLSFTRVSYCMCSVRTHSGTRQVILSYVCCFDGAERQLRYGPSPLTGSSQWSMELNGRTQCFAHKRWISYLENEQD